MALRKGIKRVSSKTYITTTNACVFDINENIMRVLKLRNWSVFEFDFMDALEDKGEVLQSHGLVGMKTIAGMKMVSPHLWIAGHIMYRLSTTFSYEPRCTHVLVLDRKNNNNRLIFLRIIMNNRLRSIGEAGRSLIAETVTGGTLYIYNKKTTAGLL